MLPSNGTDAWDNLFVTNPGSVNHTVYITLACKQHLDSGCILFDPSTGGPNETMPQIRETEG